MTIQVAAQEITKKLKKITPLMPMPFLIDEAYRIIYSKDIRTRKRFESILKQIN